MSTHSHRGNRVGWRPRRREDPFAGIDGEKSLPEALADLTVPGEEVSDAKRETRAQVPERAYPYGDIPAGEALDRIADTDPLSPSTAVLAISPGVRTAIGDSITMPEPGAADTAAQAPPEHRVPPETRALLYTEPGWTHALSLARVRSGEWEDLHALCNATMARAVASLSAATWNARDTVSEGWREVCLAAGRTDQIVPGWTMIRDLARQAAIEREAARRPQPTFTPAPPTRPQPALRERTGMHRSAA